jgi:hypothetical protein
LPDEVKTAIRNHLTDAVNHAISGYESANEEEDTLTGDLGASLRSGERRVFVPPTTEERAGEWKWSITYRKFRGRGPRATEKALGADGIFELKLELGGRVEQKSLLFQAKVAGEGGRGLLEQCIKLTTWREAAFVLVFSESAITAVSLDEAIRRRGTTGVDTGKSLDLYLGTDFLDCEIGDNELHYDARKRRLIWRSMNGEIVATQFSVGHRISFKVQAPIRDVDRMITPEEIYQFRMQVSDDDLLGIRSNLDPTTVKNAQRQLLATYHPDGFSELDEDMRQIITRRMQETNVAVERRRSSK